MKGMRIHFALITVVVIVGKAQASSVMVLC